MPRGEGETLTYHSVLMARGPMHSFPGTQRYLGTSGIKLGQSQASWGTWSLKFPPVSRILWQWKNLSPGGPPRGPSDAPLALAAGSTEDGGKDHPAFASWSLKQGPP